MAVVRPIETMDTEKQKQQRQTSINIDTKIYVDVLY